MRRRPQTFTFLVDRRGQSNRLRPRRRKAVSQRSSWQNTTRSSLCFSSLVMEAPLSSGWRWRGSRMGGRALGTLIPLDGRWSSTPLERPMKRRDRCRDRRTVPLDASGCGFPSTAGSQASNVLNLLRSTSNIDLRTASQNISTARRVPVYLKRDDATPQGTHFLSIG